MAVYNIVNDVHIDRICEIDLAPVDELGIVGFHVFEGRVVDDIDVIAEKDLDRGTVVVIDNIVCNQRSAVVILEILVAIGVDDDAFAIRDIPNRLPRDQFPVAINPVADDEKLITSVTIGVPARIGRDRATSIDGVPGGIIDCVIRYRNVIGLDKCKTAAAAGVDLVVIEP
jgi:hypothetical protein